MTSNKRKYIEMDEIQDLKDEITNLRQTIHKLENQLLKKIADKQAKCAHEVFDAEDNGDCHKSGWNYVCVECGLLLCSRPSKCLINYPSYP